MERVVGQGPALAPQPPPHCAVLACNAPISQALRYINGNTNERERERRRERERERDGKREKDMERERLP